MRDEARMFLQQAGWGDAVITPVAGDLSDRHYVRLTKPDGTAILMDAGSDGASTHAFQTMTKWLRSIGLSAPSILAAVPDAGLLLLEDLGKQSVNDLLSDAQNADAIFETCIDLLLTIRRQPTVDLMTPTAHDLAQWTTLADQFYPGADANLLNAFRAVLETELTRFSTLSTMSLRDFHADNLMWLPERSGVRKLGLLDYQDAFLTHPVYDLVSLLTDARMDVSRQTRQTYISAYAAAAGDDLADLEPAFAVFSAQRNLRILGIFHRAASEHGKRHHLPKVPRVYRYFLEAVEHPVFEEVRSTISTALPPPKDFA